VGYYQKEKEAARSVVYETKSEELLERFIADNNITFEKIKENKTSRPTACCVTG
jgi:hypothetical protein